MANTAMARVLGVSHYPIEISSPYTTIASGTPHTGRISTCYSVTSNSLGFLSGMTMVRYLLAEIDTYADTPFRGC